MNPSDLKPNSKWFQSIIKRSNIVSNKNKCYFKFDEKDFKSKKDISWAQFRFNDLLKFNLIDVNEDSCFK